MPQSLFGFLCRGVSTAMNTLATSLRHRTPVRERRPQSPLNPVANARVEANRLPAGPLGAPKQPPLITLPATFDVGDADHVGWLLDTVERALAERTDLPS
jgi:hypothetical protein